jgi:hypothetical protein
VKAGSQASAEFAHEQGQGISDEWGESFPRSYSFYYDDRGNLRGTQYPNTTFSWTDTNPDGWTTDTFNRHGEPSRVSRRLF